MPKNTKIDLEQNQQSYRMKILKNFERMMEKSQNIISSGYDEYQSEETSQSYPVDAYIRIEKKTIVIVPCESKQLTEVDVQTIFCERFRTLSKDEDIIAIIDSSQGYESQAIAAIAAESYPLVLTQQTVLVSMNSQAEKMGNGFNIINELFSKVRNSLPHDELLDEDDYENIAFVLDGDVRTPVFLSLENRPKYALEIVKEKKLYEASAYRALHALEQKEIIECRNPCSKRRKYYQLTARGAKIKEEVKKFKKKMTSRFFPTPFV